MKTFALHLIALLIFAGCNGVIAQTETEPILFDEHSNLPCDESLAHLDHFYAELQNHPNSTGFILITNKPENRRNTAFRQAMIEGYTRFRNFDPARFKIVRANSGEEMRVQFWRVPAGAIEPPVQDIDMSYLIPRTAKPFIFTFDDTWDDPICPGISGQSILIEFLKQNPRARINIVSRDVSANVARRRVLRAASRIINGSRIARTRIRTFVAKPDTIPYINQPSTEYWYLP